MKTRLVLSALFFNLAICATAFAISIGKPTGFVNDFAKVLSNTERASLENTLKEYEAQTDIEIAVVTVTSLQDLSVEEFVQELGESWGVGKRGKDNGIVFLIAPTEHKLRIATGYGIEPDLTDFQAKQIIDHDVVPLFKASKMVEGITRGVQLILSELGTKPYEARVEERKQEALRSATEEKLRREQSARKMKFFLLVLLVGSVGAAMVAGIVLLIKKRMKLERLHKEIGELLKICEIGICTAAEDTKDRDISLNELKEISPKTVWDLLDGKNILLIKTLDSYREKLTSLQRTHKKGLRYANEIRSKVELLHKETSEASGLLSQIREKIAEVKKARQESNAEISPRELPRLFSEITEELVDVDVKPESREILSTARQTFDKALKITEQSLANWLVVRELLHNSRDLAERAGTCGKSDKREALEARTEAPKLLKRMPRQIAEAEGEIDDSDVSAETKELVKKAKRKYSEAARLADATPLNWLVVYAALLATLVFVKKAKEEAGDDKRAARRRRSNASSYPSYSGSSSWSSGSSFSGGSSSGGSSGGSGGFSFGGGSFGGGGASGSW